MILTSIERGPVPSFLLINGEKWKEQKARKPAQCAYSGNPIVVGDTVYAPFGNGLNRSARILARRLRSHYPTVFDNPDRRD